MKSFSQLSKELNPLTEAPKKTGKVVTAPEVEKKLAPLLDDPDISSKTTRYIKDILKSSKMYGGTFILPDSIKSIVGNAKEELKKDKKGLEVKKALKEMKPITICDILSEPQPKMFKILMKSDAEEVMGYALDKILGHRAEFDNDVDIPSWVDKLDKYSKVMGDWLEQEGGSKLYIIPRIVEMQACSKNAGWARWSGKAYRGVERTVDRLKQYKYTGEITTLESGKELYLVATVKYKSRYAVQSWTPKLSVAKKFATSEPYETGRAYGVIMEIDITDKESFLSPEIVNSISSYKESEVLRVSDKPTTVTAYVAWKKLSEYLESKLVRGGLKVGEEARNLKKIQAELAEIVGTSAAKTLMGKAEIEKWINRMMKGR